MITYLYEKTTNVSKTVTKTITKKKRNRKLNTNKIDVKYVTCTQKINQSLLMEGIFSKLLDTLIEGKLTLKIINNYINSYIEYSVNEENRHFDRVCKTPFKKWYIKQLY
jgi:hypothetical protein